MAAGNIFKYTFLSICIFCSTKMLYFIKDSGDNNTRYLAYDDRIYYNNIHRADSPISQEESNMIKFNSRISDVVQQHKNMNEDAEKSIKKNNSTTLSTNNLKRKRKLLSQMWDKYYKIKEQALSGIQYKTNRAFRQIGNDIFVYSVFYDDQSIYKNGNPVLQIVTISKLQSRSNLVCNFSNRRDGQWVTAVKHELSDNHGKLYGGVVYTCNIPHTLSENPPKTIHLQSQITQDDNLSKVTSALVSMEVIWIEMSNWESAIYHNTNNLKKPPSGSNNIDFANNFLETFPKRNAMRKNQTIDKSQKSSTEIDQGRQLDFNRAQNYAELPRTRNNEISSISICVPPLFGNIRLSEFIQFVEIHKIFGVSKIFFYKMNVSSDIDQMLTYYQSQGVVTVHDWTLPDELQNYQNNRNIWYNGQTTAQQDCLYRSKGKYNYTAFIDLDEVIVPRTAADWPQMLEVLDKTYSDGETINTAAFSFRSAFFESGNTINKKSNIRREKLSFLEKSSRSDIISSNRNKVIVKPNFIEIIGIHHVSEFVNSESKLRAIDVPVNTALIHHYRKCTEALDTEMHCGKYVADTSLLKYSEMLKKNYEEALDNNLKHFKTIK